MAPAAILFTGSNAAVLQKQDAEYTSDEQDQQRNTQILRNETISLSSPRESPISLMSKEKKNDSIFKWGY